MWMNGKILMKHCLKKRIFSNLNMEAITDSDYMHGKRVCKEFEIKNLVNFMIFILKMRRYI